MMTARSTSKSPNRTRKLKSNRSTDQLSIDGEVMKHPIKTNVNRWCSLAIALAASAIALGCSSLSYVDPNPSQPYAFPGQNQTPNRAAALAPQTPVAGPSATPGRPPLVPNNNIGTTPVAVNPAAAFNRPPTETTDQGGFSIIRIGDSLNISFTDVPTPIMIQPQRVGEDGNITLPYNVTVKAAGKTPGQLQEDIRKE